MVPVVWIPEFLTTFSRLILKRRHECTPLWRSPLCIWNGSAILFCTLTRQSTFFIVISIKCTNLFRIPISWMASYILTWTYSTKMWNVSMLNSSPCSNICYFDLIDGQASWSETTLILSQQIFIRWVYSMLDEILYTTFNNVIPRQFLEMLFLYLIHVAYFYMANSFSNWGAPFLNNLVESLPRVDL